MSWEAIPTGECTEYDHTRGTLNARERCKVSLMIIGMSLIGVGIGCLFIFIRWVTGMERAVH